MKNRTIFLLVFACIAIVNQSTAQNNFEFEFSLGITHPKFTNDEISSDFDEKYKINSLNLVSNIKVHYVNKGKDLFFVQLLYSKSGVMEYDITNIKFELI